MTQRTMQISDMGVKMNDIKCPFCKEKIISDVCCMFDKKNKDYTNGTQIYKCNKCGLFGNKKLWQGLIRTRKALDVAKDKLDTVRQYHRGTAVIRPDDIAAYCDRAIEQIMALEQKD